MKELLPLAVWLVVVLPAVAVAEPLLSHVDVYTSGTCGYHTFRIPTIETAPNGTLLAFAEARKHSRADPGFGKQDIDLALKRSTDGGRSWSKMAIIDDPGEGWSAANAVTVVDRSNGRVWVLYIRSKPGRSSQTSRPGTDDMQILARHSDNNGATWSEPTDLTRVARDLDDPKWRVSVPGPGGGIQDRQGRLVVPVWKTDPMGACAIFSDDHGRTWQRGAFVPGASGNEDQLVELADGRLLIDIRQAGGGCRWLATSADGGRTWAKPRPGAAESLSGRQGDPRGQPDGRPSLPRRDAALRGLPGGRRAADRLDHRAADLLRAHLASTRVPDPRRQGVACALSRAGADRVETHRAPFVGPLQGLHSVLLGDRGQDGTRLASRRPRLVGTRRRR